MLSHSDIWRAIDALARRHELSISGLAKKAGLDPTAFNRSKRLTPAGHMRWPATESIARVLECTGTSLADFLTLMGEKMPRSSEEIPFLDFSRASQSGFFDDQGCPSGKGWDQILFPSHDEKTLYALEISGEDMEPVFRDGDCVIVSPQSQVRRGDRVVARMKTGDILVRKMGRKTAKTIELKRFSSESSSLFALSDLEWVSRIVWSSQ